LVEHGSDIYGSSNGDFEVHTLVNLPGGLAIVLNDAYWGRLCICEVNRVIGSTGLANIITVFLFPRELGETWRLNGLPPPKPDEVRRDDL